MLNARQVLPLSLECKLIQAIAQPGFPRVTSEIANIFFMISMSYKEAQKRGEMRRRRRSLFLHNNLYMNIG